MDKVDFNVSLYKAPLGSASGISVALWLVQLIFPVSHNCNSSHGPVTVSGRSSVVGHGDLLRTAGMLAG